jgi:hypothetical protein
MGVFAGPEVVESGLVLALDAANRKSYPGSGTTWTDLSGNGNNGTLVNGVGYNSANLGSLSFDGVDDNGSFPINLLNSVENFTLSFYVKRDSSKLNGSIFSAVLGPGNLDLFNLGFNSVYTNLNNIQFRYFNYFNEAPSFNIQTDLNNYNWNYIVLLRDGNTFGLYVNGVIKTSISDVLIPRNIPGLKIGVSSGAGGNAWGYFKGNIAQVSIYNRALTAQEIQQNYLATKSRFGL